MANDVKALVITGVGLNCEKETAAAFTSSGARQTNSFRLNIRQEIGRAHV